MRKAVFGSLLVFGLLSLGGAYLAQAGGRHTVALACQAGVTASVAGHYETSLFAPDDLGDFSLSCTGTSHKAANAKLTVSTSGVPGAAHISTFSVTSNAGSGGCPGDSTLPLSSTCTGTSNPSDPSATLTVK